MQESRENHAARLTVDCAIKVHSALGPGLLESVYEACLTHELSKCGIDVERQRACPVHYDSIRLDAGFRLDLVVDRCLIVEVKAVKELSRLHLAQLLTYLRLTQYRLGLLMNFNVQRMKDGIRRVANGL